jgi:nucleotide-binding universal stress UspA family protein
MKPIICVTDFTDLTIEAARTASAFAQRWNERVILVHSVDEREQFPYPLRERLAGSDGHRLAEEARQLRQRGFDFEEKVLRGMPEDGIAGFAWRSGAGLVVVGSAPTANLEHWALGCIAEEISDTSLVPVLALRSAAPFERWLAGDAPLKIWMAVDPAARPDAMLHRIDELRELGPCAISATFVLYPENPFAPSPLTTASSGERPTNGFVTDRDPLETTAGELAAREARLIDSHPRPATATQLINDATDTAADLIMVTSHPRKDLTLLPHRSLCHGVVCHAPMSVLCVPEPDIEPPHHAAQARHAPAMASFPDRAGSRARSNHDKAVR